MKKKQNDMKNVSKIFNYVIGDVRDMDSKASLTRQGSKPTVTVQQASDQHRQTERPRPSAAASQQHARQQLDALETQAEDARLSLDDWLASFNEHAFPSESARINPLENFTRVTEIASRIAALMPTESVQTHLRPWR